MSRETWLQSRQYSPEALSLAKQALAAIRAGGEVEPALRRHALSDGRPLAKHALVAAYRQLTESGEWAADAGLLERIRMKPVRTLSGVSTVTVLTKPYPCPGKCIFCPTDVRMPKSYLPDEPGARRGLEHHFDPYAQTASRLRALEAVGHPTDKVELLILGGTWSAYRRDYQEWFVRRCFEALNETVIGIVGAGLDTSSKSVPTSTRPAPTDVVDVKDVGAGLDGLHDQTRHSTRPAPTTDDVNLETLHRLNETAAHRNVGLVIETRPDEITPDELAWLRRLGVTKVQMGVQSMDDRILQLNQRGHDAAESVRAASLLRAAGFKIVAHWMPNLLGATPESDRADFARLWQDLCPDEIKIYPNQLLENAELYDYWLRGEYQPYTTQELVDLIADIKPTIPRYCRVNRVIRDIPSTYVVEGNKRTSLRQDALAELARRGQRCQCVRCREVRGQKVERSSLRLDDLVYTAGGSEEHFLSFVTPDDRIAGFLRLGLPKAGAPETGMSDLDGAALIREVHVYGQSLEIGAENGGAAQHSGLGTRLLQRAEEIAYAQGYPRLAVIAAIGTRRYYLARGFERGGLFLTKALFFS